jgi:hypothetical protein
MNVSALLKTTLYVSCHSNLILTERSYLLFPRHHPYMMNVTHGVPADVCENDISLFFSLPDFVVVGTKNDVANLSDDWWPSAVGTV